MKKYRWKDFKGGWFIGNFEPSLLKNKFFEVAIHFYKKDQEWPKHYHKEAREYNMLISGEMTINDFPIEENEIFVIDQYEIAEPKYQTDCTVLIIKVPSVPGDKYEVL